ncbi:MAG TPA: hypothetical protein VF101_01970 [Gaiellaceae bacterium]
MSTSDYLQTLGHHLDEAWERRYGPVSRRPRGRRLRVVKLAAVPAVVAAAALVALTRSSGPGALDAARAAVGSFPAGTIVHFTSVTHDPSGAISGRTELWGATSPPYAFRSIIRDDDGTMIEQGASGDAMTQYDPAGVVYVRTLAGGIAEGTRPADFAESADQIRADLADGTARDVGEVSVGGTKLHRFVVSPSGGGTCTYDVQPETYYGVAMTCAGLPTGSIAERWDYLPRSGNETLLSVTAQHPGARVETAPMRSCGQEKHTAHTPPCVVNAPGA